MAFSDSEEEDEEENKMENARDGKSV